jgi:GxxExxY protein
MLFATAMPITPRHSIIRISQDQFRELSYSVMGEVFQIHNEFGRLFDERIYKRELAYRIGNVELEFPIVVSHGTFTMTYYLDALIAHSGPFEFKAIDVLTPWHRGQLYNYLVLLDVAHGKLVNLRPENVDHEFINALVRTADRHRFTVNADRWDATLPGADRVIDHVLSVLRDWGTGLELRLYEAALIHFLGGAEHVWHYVQVQSNGHLLGRQPMRLVADGIAFRLTTFDSGLARFEVHLRRMLQQTELRAILWVNIAACQVTFASIKQGV